MRVLLGALRTLHSTALCQTCSSLPVLLRRFVSARSVPAVITLPPCPGPAGAGGIKPACTDPPFGTRRAEDMITPVRLTLAALAIACATITAAAQTPTAAPSAPVAGPPGVAA